MEACLCRIEAITFPAESKQTAKSSTTQEKSEGQNQNKRSKKKKHTIDKHNLILWFNAAKQKFCYSSLEGSQTVIYRNHAQKVHPLPIRDRLAKSKDTELI